MRDARTPQISSSTASASSAEAVFHAPMTRNSQLRANALSGDSELGESPTSDFDMLRDEDRPQEECGVFGIYAPGVDVARRTFFGIFALQHRGQESAGIAVSDGQKIRAHTDMGLVTQIFNEEVLSGLSGDIAVGHNRYSTTGSSKACNAQPILCESSDGTLAVAHNGNLVNAHEIREAMEKVGEEFVTSMDTEIIAKMIESGRDKPLEGAIFSMMERVSGAYSLVLMTRDTLIAVRDPNGLRPLCLGKLIDCEDEHCYVVASETCALGPVGATFVREIEPGEILFINGDGLESIHFTGKAPGHSRATRCAFSSSSTSRAPIRSCWDKASTARGGAWANFCRSRRPSRLMW